MANNILDPNTGKPFTPSFLGNIPVPRHAAFSAIWNQISKTFRSRFDEATRQSWTDALAMRRDGYIEQLMQARKMPTALLDWHLRPTDVNNAKQVEICDELTQIVEAIPRFQALKMGLLEAIWYGRAGCQLAWDYKMINGKRRLTVVDHSPISGDKIIFKWTGTPGILVFRGYTDKNAKIEITDRGMALFLYEDYWRDRFILHQHIPMDADFLFETDQANMIKGVGLRHFAYYLWWFKRELESYMMDGLQRISSNGMLYGFYEDGNAQAQQDMIDAMISLVRDNVAVFPKPAGQDMPNDWIKTIPPSNIAYDTMYQVIQYYNEVLRLLFLGQSLSSTHEGGWVGSEVANLQATTLQHLIRFDANGLAESLDVDLLNKIIKYNYGTLDFEVHFQFEIDRVDVKDTLEAAERLHNMGVELDQQNLRELGGFAAPQLSDDKVGGKQEISNKGNAKKQFFQKEKMDLTGIVMIRHPETALNKTHQIRGHKDVPLDAQGKKQAVKIASWVEENMQPTRIYCSDLQRSEKLAQLIGTNCSCKVYPNYCFRPWDVGIWTGMESTSVHPKLMQRAAHPDEMIEGGESFATFRDRLLGGLKALMASYETDKKDIVLVGHFRTHKITEAWLVDEMKDINLTVLGQDDAPTGCIMRLYLEDGIWKYQKHIIGDLTAE